jgi:hypothetical protein
VSAIRALRVKPAAALCAAGALAASLALGACGGATPNPGYPSGYRPVWLCRPGLARNPCVTRLQTGVFSAKGKLERVYTPHVPANPPVDCFYVYPTVSSEFSMLSDLKIQPAETDVALYQAAYFRPACRMYAPMYHQVTEIGAANLGLLTLAELHKQYNSVLWAFRYYLAHYNHGRAFVLIGHSQGAFTLSRLIRKVIDPNPALRHQMLSAMLFGGGVVVKTGKLIGGNYKHIPGCTSPSQLSCVISYSSFNGAPPMGNVFGDSTYSPTDASLPLVPGQQILCTNPAALGGGSGYLDSVFPLAFPPAIGNEIPPSETLKNRAATAWYEFTDAYRARCEQSNGSTILEVTGVNGAPQPYSTGALAPLWGLHQLDVNLSLGDSVHLVESEAKAYLARSRG